jgi:hypothetical protein
MKEAPKGCVGFEGKKSKQVLREQSEKTFTERLKPKERRFSLKLCDFAERNNEIL